MCQHALFFGAGASYGYSTRARYLPPVVRNLFNDVENHAVYEVINKPEHSSIKGNRDYILRELVNHDNDLEKYLSSLYKRRREDTIFGNLLAYLEDVFFLASSNIDPSSSNNYKSLINLMWDNFANDKWSCISFNYDTILEQSFLHVDRDPTRTHFDNIHNYSNGNPAILKLHGGINFRYVFTHPKDSAESARFTRHALFSRMMADKNPSSNYHRVIKIGAGKPPVYKEVNIKNEGNSILCYQFNFPLMLVPIHASVAPENAFFNECLDSAKNLLSNSKLIIAIGYNFGDEAFLEKMKDAEDDEKEIILVNTTQSVIDLDKNLAFKRLKKEMKKMKIRVFNGDGFGEFVEALH